MAIARALINLPQIVFADELREILTERTPTRYLSFCSKREKTIGLTLVMVTHDMKIAKRADRVFVMENGELHERKLNMEEG